MTDLVQAVRLIEQALTALAAIPSQALSPEDRVEVRTHHDRLERLADRLIPTVVPQCAASQK